MRCKADAKRQALSRFHHSVPQKRPRRSVDLAPTYSCRGKATPGAACLRAMRLDERCAVMSTRILLADEMVMLRQALKAFLEQEGLAVVAEAADGHEAVELARKHRPDVAVLDIAIRGLNGLQVTRELQRTCPSIRVILLSMPVDDQDVVEVLRCGARGLLVKTQP